MSTASTIGPNYGVVQTLPSATVHRLLVPVTTSAYAISSFLFFAVLVGILTDWVYWLRIVLALWLFGNTWRRVVPVLWAENGKLSYLPSKREARSVPETCASADVAQAGEGLVHRDRTLQWWSRFFQVLWDAVLLSLACVSTACRTSPTVAMALVWLVPPSAASKRVSSSAPFYIAFWTLPLVNVAASIGFYGVVFFMNRMKPEQLSHRRALLRLAACLVAFLSVPALLVSMSAFSCEKRDGVEVMTFAPATRCGSARHRVHSVFAAVFLALGALATETAVGSVQLLQAPGSVTATSALRASAPNNEVRLIVKWLCVFVLTMRSASVVKTLWLLVLIALVGLGLSTRPMVVTNEKFLATFEGCSSLLLFTTCAALLVANMMH